MNVGSLFDRHARYRPDHTAVVFGDQRLTYREFDCGINRAANALAELGVRKGDKVATLLPNCLELLELYWAVGKLGAVVVPLSTLLLEGALVSLLQDSDSVALVSNCSFLPLLERVRARLPDLGGQRTLLVDGPLPTGYGDYHNRKAVAADTAPSVELDPDDPFNIMYTSGTTGQPKGIVHSHRIRTMYGACFAAAFRMTPECVTAHSGAIVFNGAFVDLMPTVFQGGTYVLVPQFDPVEFIATVAREKVTHVMLVPSQIVALLGTPGFEGENLDSLEMLLSLGAPLLQEHKRELNQRLPGRFYELYGLTEGFVTVLDREDYAAKPNSVGVPTPLFEMRILDDAGEESPPNQVGEICGRGPILMSGYYKRPDLTAEAIRDGWLHSGDLGYVDEDGFLYLVDRKKDMIISGGVNVYPRDIEEIVAQHPAVQEVAVFGTPHDRWGEAPVAAVVRKAGQDVPAEVLKEWINGRVGAKFQRVHQVRLYTDFPRNAAGKILKRVLRESEAPG